jgi:hypothetical protein
MPNEEELLEGGPPFQEQPRTNRQLQDFEEGLNAGQAGIPNDDTKSEAWQRGWADAQE